MSDIDRMDVHQLRARLKAYREYYRASKKMPIREDYDNHEDWLQDYKTFVMSLARQPLKNEGQ